MLMHDGGSGDSCSGTSSGLVTVTDGDTIERSNLNRQFLFSQKDVGALKATTAAAAAMKMRPGLRVESHSDKVGPSTAAKFSQNWWAQQHVTLNALDNAAARQYTDMRSGRAGCCLVDSGTTGAKGHVQVVVPLLTESWGATQDPPELDIPYCTLKDFPSEINHTIVWATEQLKNSYLDGDLGPGRLNHILAKTWYSSHTSQKRNFNLLGLLLRVGVVTVSTRVVLIVYRAPLQFLVLTWSCSGAYLH